MKKLAENIIQDHKVFRSLSKTNKEFLGQHSIYKTYKKGTSIWNEGDIADCCIFILEGLVEIIRISERGIDNIIGIFGPGDIIGLSAILKRGSYPANAVVATRSCEALNLYIRAPEKNIELIEKENFYTWEKEYLLIHEQVLRDKIMILCAGELEDRVIELFEQLRLRFSIVKSPREGSFTIPFALTKTQIAKIIEARVESTIRILRRWEKNGNLEINSKNMTIRNWDSIKKSVLQR